MSLGQLAHPSRQDDKPKRLKKPLLIRGGNKSTLGRDSRSYPLGGFVKNDNTYTIFESHAMVMGQGLGKKLTIKLVKIFRIGKSIGGGPTSLNNSHRETEKQSM